MQEPNYFVTSSHTTVPLPSNCVAMGATGIFLDLQNYVADQHGVALRLSGIQPIEFVNNDPPNPTYATPVTTRPDGTFDDVPFGSCFVGPGCSNFNVDHSADYNGKTFNIPTNYDTRECESGIRILITGNPSGLNTIFTEGTVR